MMISKVMLAKELNLPSTFKINRLLGGKNKNFRVHKNTVVSKHGSASCVLKDIFRLGVTWNGITGGKTVLVMKESSTLKVDGLFDVYDALPLRSKRMPRCVWAAAISIPIRKSIASMTSKSAKVLPSLKR